MVRAPFSSLCFSVFGAVALAVALPSGALLATEGSPEVAAVAGSAGIDLRLTDDTRAVELRVAGPAGEVLRRSFAAGSTPSFAVEREDGSRHADGAYTWELRSIASPLRTRGEAEAGGEGIAEAGWVASGAFSIRNGAVVAADERERGDARATQPAAAPASVLAPMDQVIPDDLIVQGSACVGLDCVNGESFGFDTIRLKENNLRIKFEDTSVGAFPTTDWQLTANDSASGGQAKFSIEDITGSRVPFTVEGGATTDSVYVDSTGRVGFRTATPVLDLHVNTSNTPGQRLEQNSSGGFTAQTWDIAGNEANFFVRDVTGGSRLPFRIRPGAPTSSIDISADGKVGIGTASPGQKLDVAEGDVKVSKTNGGTTSFFIVNTGGVNTSSWILRANSANGAFTFTESGVNTPFRIFKGAAANTLDVTTTGVNVVGALSVGGTPMNVPDYVFEPGYRLTPLADQEAFFRQHKHLPAVPPAKLGEDGRPVIDLAAYQMGMLEELEKAHLYIQQIDDELKAGSEQISALEQQNAELRAQLERQQAELEARLARLEAAQQ